MMHDPYGQDSHETPHYDPAWNPPSTPRSLPPYENELADLRKINFLEHSQDRLAYYRNASRRRFVVHLTLLLLSFPLAFISPTLQLALVSLVIGHTLADSFPGKWNPFSVHTPYFLSPDDLKQQTPPSND